MFGGDCGDRAGIQPTTQEDAERDIRHEMTRNRVFQHLSVGPDIAVERLRLSFLRCREIPVLLQIDSASHIYRQRMTGQQLAYAGIESILARKVSEREVLGYGRFIQSGA